MILAKKKNIEYYLSLPWAYRIEWSDEDDCFVAFIGELKGCMAHGSTFKEATDEIQSALFSYIENALEYGDEIPEPLKQSDCKGRIAYRTSSDNHCKIARRAKSLGLSISKFLDAAVEEKLAY